MMMLIAEEQRAPGIEQLLREWRCGEPAAEKKLSVERSEP